MAARRGPLSSARAGARTLTFVLAAVVPLCAWGDGRSWPTPAQYDAAMHHAASTLIDPSLHGAKVLHHPDLKTPVAYPGNFGSVYRLTTPSGREVALRVLHPPAEWADAADPGRQAMVSLELSRLRRAGWLPPELVDYRWLPMGIRVDGRVHPVAKMPWVDGISLDEWVADRVAHAPAGLNTMALNWRAANRDLAQLGISHGDFHADNILVEANGSMRFVDYGAMYVPTLAGWRSREIGHRNYQHPRYHFPTRNERPFGPRSDHFSSIAIYLSLVALAQDPSLFARFHEDHRLLFRAEDFLHPESYLFQALARSPSPEVRELSAALARYAQADPQTVPSLEEALAQAHGGVAPPLPLSFGQRSMSNDLVASTGKPRAPRPPGPLLLGSAARSQTAEEVLAPTETEGQAAAPPPPRPAAPAVRARASATPRARPHGHLAPIVPTALELPYPSRENPGLLMMLLDLSGSMGQGFAGQNGIRKVDALADLVNQQLESVVRHHTINGVPRDRWQVAMIGYGNVVHSAFGGALAGRDLVPLGELARNVMGTWQGTDLEGRKVPHPVWLSPVAGGRYNTQKGTHPGLALQTMQRLITAHPTGGSKLIVGVHVTDGIASQDPIPQLRVVTAEVARRGWTLLMTNVHLSANGGTPIVFPTEADLGSLDAHGRQLFSMSSVIPEELRAQLGARPGARLMAYNADPGALAAILRAGTSFAVK
jgi:hypothetical protein